MDAGIGIGGHSKNIEEMTSSKLDLFSPTIIEKGVEKGFRVLYYPSSYFGNDGLLEVVIHPDPEKYIDVPTMLLHAKARLMKEGENGALTPVRREDKVTLANNGLQSLWSTGVVTLNDTEIGETSTNSYAYGAYLQTFLGAKQSCKDTLLKSRLFMKEKIVGTPNFMELESYQTRQMLTSPNGWFEINMPIHNDLMTATKYLPPNSKLTVTFKRASEAFSLHQLDDSNYKIEVKDLHLSVVKYSVNEAILNHYHKTKKTITPTIPYTKNVLKTYPVTRGNYDLSNHNLFYGNRLPERVYIMMVDQDAFNGNKKKSPYQFQHYDMKDACLMVNNVSEPSNPYKLDIENDEFKDLYFQFLENTGTSPFEMDSVDIDIEDYYFGNFILAFDRSPTKDNGLYTHKMEGGHLGIRMHCKKPLEQNIQVLVYASYSSKIEFVEDKVTLEVP